MHRVCKIYNRQRFWLGHRLSPLAMVDISDISIRMKLLMVIASLGLGTYAVQQTVTLMNTATEVMLNATA